MLNAYSEDRAVELYADFKSNQRSLEPLRLAPYPKIFEEGEYHVLVMPFHTVSRDVAREIANSINDFGRYITMLRAWQFVYEKVPEEDQFSLLLDHIRPLTTLCLGAPQALRGRLIFAATASSYHANIFLDLPGGRPSWDGGHTSMKTAKGMSQAWPTWPALATCLNEMAKTTLSEVTNDFRNQHEHGHPRSIGIGHTSWVQATNIDGRGAWSLGEHKPLQLSELLPLMEIEHGLAMASFEAYLAMLGEHNQAARRLDNAGHVAFKVT